MLLGTEKMRPTFFIGLGGSGGRVVDVLARRLVVEPHWERFKDLIHFVVVDTDANDLARLSDRVMKTNIAVRDKPRRIALYRGGDGAAPDRRVTSWVHPWYRFREQSNAGAGQIRLEARFSLHCQLAEATHHSLRHIVRGQLERALRAQEPNRPAGMADVRFFIFASTAGGTGSGASVTTAYLLRQLAKEYGAHAEVFGSFFLPSLFRGKVAQPLVPKINANGYAALKEIEHLMELRYEGGPEDVELVFEPNLTESREPTDVDVVRQAPFDWVYVIDRPEAMTIEAIYAAAGEAAYLQLFTPILGYQEREADNFRQLQTQLAAGYFALQYGSIGASVVELPRRRLTRYFARRWTVSALERLVVARGEGEHQVDVSSKAFRQLNDQEQARLLDEAFRSFVVAEARQEELEDRLGVFTEIAAYSSARTNLIEAFKERLRSELQEAEDLIEIDSVNAAAITPESPSLNAARDHLGRDFARSRQRLSTHAAAIERDIQSGAWLSRFFDEYGVTPLMQRYLLIELDRRAREELRGEYAGVDEDEAQIVEWCINPFEDAESGMHLAVRPPDPATYKVDSPEVRKSIEMQERGLVEAGKKLFKKESAFAARRQAALSLFNQLRDAAHDALVVDYWQRVCRAMQSQMEQRLEVFRVISKKGMALVSHLSEQAERARLQGLEVPDIGAERGATAEFHLGSEVFHDERAGVRQWDQVYELAVRDDLQMDMARVLGLINDALKAASTKQARRQGTTDQVLSAIATGLDALARDKVEKVLTVERPMTLASGLVLEARLANFEGAAQRLSDLERVGDHDVRGYLEEKLARVAAMSRPLGRFDEPVLAGKNLAPYRPLFYGVLPEHLKSEPLLADALAGGVHGFERLEDWHTPDLVSFYQACLGAPLYAWQEVRGPLARSYDQQVADPTRREPMHVDHRWENAGFNGALGPGLPALDPLRRKSWEDARRASTLAAAEDFAFCLAGGVVQRDTRGRFRWEFRSRGGNLGATIEQAIDRFGALSEGIRGPLRGAADDALREQPALVDETLRELSNLRFDAEADGKLAEAKAIAQLAGALA